ncbi:putative oxoglutarate dehydrogenase, E1 component [Ancylostoma caninum]|uniref:Putative oxoglutarate dehydrogenase, E1 component n=1 Tax=Ancylostoma caninum TaxID=29170 RepID=A0A368H5V0_ANCCA|nr:putative oxoglutarate dehydrogenase, E1 component [Ancylostoma caninum]
MEFGHLPDPPKTAFLSEGGMRPEDSQRVHLINAFRRYGYLQAQLDPLGLQAEKDVPELNPEVYGLSPHDALPGKDLSLNDLAEQLRLIYCGPMAIEFMHINVGASNWEERQWLAHHFENAVADELCNEERVKLAKLMLKCENFDHFLALKFPTVKRYGSEGAEAMYGFFSEVFDSAPERDIQQIFVGIAHRGRLNLLSEMMQFPVVQMFRKMKGKPEFPDGVQGSGDVLSHLTSSFDHKSPEGTVHISMLPNPSHLEAVNPVAMGKARARARSLGVGDYSKERSARTGDGVLAVLVHGDGAFTGQGIVWESIALSQVPHFRLGGTLHLVTNNQVAFTAEAHIGRSSTHCTDIAKAFEYPVIHVNGDHPEEVVKATRLAMAYRDKFRKDVFINMQCYRRWGHNELDDPSFTQPIMYRIIENRESVPRQYADELIHEGLMTEDDVKAEKEAHSAKMMESFRAIDTTPPVAKHLEGNWKGFIQAPAEVQEWDTGCDINLLKYVGAASVKVPEGFSVHPHLQKTHCDARIQKMVAGENLDWGTAEALAFGSLLMEGNDVRISGQDVGRATFSFRHAMLVDNNTDLTHIPLNFIAENQTGFLEIANNLLSEEAILGFEFGYSMENPRRLCVWEAQFGDFFNGAQIIIDTFLASAESKWLTQSGLTLLLPHGIDGMGPEHSTCRMERFLQLCDSREDQVPVDGENINLRIANPTTSAQYFHLLRRQVLFKKYSHLLLLS